MELGLKLATELLCGSSPTSGSLPVTVVGRGLDEPQGPTWELPQDYALSPTSLKLLGEIICQCGLSYYIFNMQMIQISI